MADSITFSRSLYLPEAVDAAVTAFGALATFEVDHQGDDIEVSVSDIDERVTDRLVDALCNHVLYETVARTRALAEEGNP